MFQGRRFFHDLKPDELVAAAGLRSCMNPSIEG